MSEKHYWLVLTPGIVMTDFKILETDEGILEALKPEPLHTVKPFEAEVQALDEEGAKEEALRYLVKVGYLTEFDAELIRQHGGDRWRLVRRT